MASAARTAKFWRTSLLGEESFPVLQAKKQKTGTR
jgi:hypothetical protein